METNAVIAILACIVIIYIVGRLFSFPLRQILKLIINSILGGILIWIINLAGGLFNFHIGLNIVTAIFVRNIRHSRSSAAGCV